MNLSATHLLRVVDNNNGQFKRIIYFCIDNYNWIGVAFLRIDIIYYNVSVCPSTLMINFI